MNVQARLANRTILDQTALTSDPTLRAVFNEDAVSVGGDVLALAGLGLGPDHRFVSTSSSGCGAHRACTHPKSGFGLSGRNHDFPVGQPMPPDDKDRVRTFLLAYPGVTQRDQSAWSFRGCVQAGVFLARSSPDYSLSDRVIHRGVTGLAV
jgi:hypothetical protein